MAELPLFALTICVLLGLIVLGEWIAVALGVSGLLAILILNGTATLSNTLYSIGTILWNNSTSFTLTTIPMFLLMGDLIVESELSSPFYQAIGAWIGRLPGGLLHANILTCTVFAAVTGSSAATSAALAPIAVPELRRRKYNVREVLGSVSAGGTLGILIPPSVGMIVYSAISQQPVGKLFIAGLVPGLLTASLFSVYILVRCVRDRTIAPLLPRVPLSTKIRTSAPIAPVLLLILAILFVIYRGIATPEEAAAAGCIGAIIIGATIGKLRLPGLLRASVRAAYTTAMVLFLIIGAQILSFYLVESGINRDLTSWVGNLPVPTYVIFVAIVLLYFILGMFLDGISMILLTIPVLYPVIVTLRLDPIWFGVMLMLLVEIGGITPPVGPNLFIIQASAADRPLSDVVIGSLPYIGVLLLVVVLLWLFPGIALGLVQQMGR